MKLKSIPINKGNYSMESPKRETAFEAHLAEGWEEEYKAYRNNWSEFPRLQHVSEYPLLVDIELSSVCNLRCPMCYTISPEFKKNVNPKLMNFDLFKQVVNEIAGNVPAIRLSLRGEAFLHKHFIDCVRYAKKKGIKEVSSLTNGALLTGKFLADVVDAGIDWITVSIDGIGSTYEQIRKPIKFTEILAHIKEIHTYKKKRGLHKPVIKVQGIWPAIRESPQAYYDIFSPYVDLLAFNPLIDYRHRDHDVVYVKDFNCPQQYQRLVIGADGLVMKCSNDEENREVIGDIKSQTVHKVWHGEKMQQVRKMMMEHNGYMQSKVCRQCYLPRRTIDSEISIVNGQEVIIKNYVNRPQDVGS